MKYDLSIVIPVFNNWAYTKNCINNLKQLPKDRFEIIIIDNNSTDKTNVEINNLLSDNIKYIRNNSNFGFGKSVNIGINSSNSDKIMILNNDIKFGLHFKEWFNGLSEKIIDNCLIGPTGGLVDRDNGFSFVYETSDYKKTINYMSGWCLSATKSTWESLKVSDGPFDSDTFFLYYEDTDLGFRAMDLGVGFKIIDCPLIHIGKQTSKLIDTNKHYLESRKKFINKWNSAHTK